MNGERSFRIGVWSGIAALGVWGAGAGFGAGIESISGAARSASAVDGTLRERLREASSKFLEASPGRDLATDFECWNFRSEIWPKVAERCEAFEAGPGGRPAKDDLLTIAADAEELPRTREMALWLLASRLVQKENEGRPAGAPRLPAFGPEGLAGLGERLSPFLESGDRISRYSAIAVIGAYGGPDSAVMLARAIKGPYLPERACACRAIGRFGVEGFGIEGLALVRPLLYDHPDVSVTPAAAHGLLLAGIREYEEHGSTTAIDELVRALRYAPHAGAARDRKDFGSWEPGKEYVIGFEPNELESTARSDAFIRFCAAVALSTLDVHELQRHVFNEMLAVLGDEEVGVVDNAFRFLDRVGVRAADWNAAATLERLLRGRDPLLSTHATRSVGQWGERMGELVPVLIEGTDDLLGRGMNAFEHISALGNSGDERAEQYLVALRKRIGPDTRYRDENGNLVDNDAKYRELIDEGLARIRRVREIKSSPDNEAAEKALDDALKDRRRRYLAPTLLGVVKNGARNEDMRVRCVQVLREIDPVAAPEWFRQMLKSGDTIPKRLREVLEEAPTPREDESDEKGSR